MCRSQYLPRGRARASAVLGQPWSEEFCVRSESREALEIQKLVSFVPRTRVHSPFSPVPGPARLCDLLRLPPPPSLATFLSPSPFLPFPLFPYFSAASRFGARYQRRASNSTANSRCSQCSAAIGRESSSVAEDIGKQLLSEVFHADWELRAFRGHGDFRLDPKECDSCLRSGVDTGCLDA